MPMTFHVEPHRVTTREQRDVAARIEATPETAKVKGMYVDSFLRVLDQFGVPRPTTQRYIAFKDYPLRDFMRMLVEACPKLHPDYSLKEALRRQGRLVYPTLISSTVGKVVFAIAGRSWEAALPLASRGYEISLNPGSATLEDVTPTSAVLALRDVYNFADSFQLGVMEGAMEVFHIDGTVVARPKLRLCDVDLVMNWR
jgi:uncharacterized protein (TIGR02265 family)